MLAHKQAYWKKRYDGIKLTVRAAAAPAHPHTRIHPADPNRIRNTKHPDFLFAATCSVRVGTRLIPSGSRTKKNRETAHLGRVDSDEHARVEQDCCWCEGRAASRAPSPSAAEPDSVGRAGRPCPLAPVTRVSRSPSIPATRGSAVAARRDSNHGRVDGDPTGQVQVGLPR